MLLCGINPMLEYTEDKGQAGHIRYTTRGNMIGLIKDSGFNVLEAKSDVVNFNASGTIRSTTLANWFPTLGRSILIYAEKK